MVHQRTWQHALQLAATVGLAGAVAIPEPTAIPARVVEAREPLVTPAAVRFDSRMSYVQRDIIDDIKSGVGGYAQSLGSVLGSDLPSFFTEGNQIFRG